MAGYFPDGPRIYIYLKTLCKDLAGSEREAGLCKKADLKFMPMAVYENITNVIRGTNERHMQSRRTRPKTVAVTPHRRDVGLSDDSLTVVRPLLHGRPVILSTVLPDGLQVQVAELFRTHRLGLDFL